MTNPKDLVNALVVTGDLETACEVMEAAVPRRKSYQLDLQMLSGHTITKVETAEDRILRGLTFHTEEDIDGSTCVPFTCSPAWEDSHFPDIQITEIDGAQSIIGKKIISLAHADHPFNETSHTQQGIYKLEAEDGSVMTITVTSFDDVTPALRANIRDFYEAQCLFHDKVIAE